MRGRVFWLVVVLVAGGGHGPATVAGAATGAEIARAVEQLGAPDHQTREAASKFLAGVGQPAQAALTTAARSKDPEVALRARELLEQIRFGFTPDTPPEVRERVRRFAGADLETRQQIVAELMAQGDATRPVLLALAATEPDEEQRLAAFAPAVEAAHDRALLLFNKESPAAAQVDQARQWVALYRRFVPGDLDLTIKLVRWLDRVNHRPAADEEFQQETAALTAQLKAAPDNPEALNNLAWFCASCRRRLDEALDYATRAAALSQDAPANLDTLAEVEFQRGNTKRALELIGRAIAQEPGVAYFTQQRARFEKGDPAVPPPTPAEEE